MKTKATLLYSLALVLVCIGTVMDLAADRLEKVADNLRERASGYDEEQVTKLNSRLLKVLYPHG